ncbi:MAG: restriction endonuclease [Anaerolineae bacterium]|nr:restriction endonuclease [Anaerolineae bacterium]
MGHRRITAIGRNPTIGFPKSYPAKSVISLRAFGLAQKGQVNPRYTTGLWLLCSSYELLMPDQDDLVYVTQKGRSFLDLPFGETEQRLDFSEGLLHLLAIVAEHGPGKRADLLPHYTDFMHTYSRVRSPRAISPSWYNRIINLVDRGLVSRDGVVYQITKAGLDYLERVATTVELQAALPVTTTSSDLRRLIDAQNDDVRAKIAGALSGIDPYQLEHIIGTLLQAMGYENVKVTQRGGDGGIDVVGDIRVGITHVREVVQVKRYKSNIQRKVLDQLRGSLHRFKAYRGTIITTGGFAKGAKDAAFEPGVPPITLIDGDRLVELLVEHNIGASRRQIDVLSFDPKAFEPEDELAEDSDFAD